MSPPPAPADGLAGKRGQLALLALAAVCAMGLWFSASAVTPQLAIAWGLDGAAQAWLTMAVQLGFVVGALLSAVLNLADRIPAPKLFAASAVVGAVANGAIPLLEHLGSGGFAVAIGCRFLTGAAIAGVYPPGMKIAATWTRADRGLGIGILVGALTVGSAAPHLLNALPAGGSGAAGMPPWPGVLWAASGLALVGAALAGFVLREGPDAAGRAPFDPKLVGRVLRHRPTVLANLGYLGHMWELYAMWAWVPIFLLASYERAGWSVVGARLAGFAAVAVGGLGSVAAGYWADRLGRTRVAVWSLATSGACCLVAGLLFDSPGLLTVLCLVWGFAVVADSAQFSAAVSELADPQTVGTALTLQTMLGYLLTLVTLRLVPWLVDAWGWRGVFPILALGPVVGIVAMARLRRRPEAARMASGRG